MRISTKGQYALRMMLDLATNDTGEYISIKSIASRQNLSEKYLEQIINLLSKAEFVRGARGAKGGYRLAMPPEDYTVGMILRCIEGSLAPIACVEENDSHECDQIEGCVLCDVWTQINDAINQVIDHITLADLMNKTADRPDKG